MTKYFIFFFLSFYQPAFTQQLYDCAAIPEILKKDAHTVKRFEKIDFEINSISKAHYKVQRVITVLDPLGKDELVFNQFTDKFNSLDEVEIKVYDESGKLTGKFKKKDLNIQSAGSGLVPEGKINYYQIPVNQYPITVEFDYTMIHNGLYSYPSYDIQSPEESVEKSSYTITVQKDNDIRFKPINIQLLPVIDETDKTTKTYSWSVNTLPAKKYESGSGNAINSYPWILLAPNKFELDGYPGEMNSWKNMGIWYNTLVKNDNTLSPAFKEEIKKMTAAATTEKEKVKIIYEYLQKNFRYVSIQLGIGGFKPFTADFVHKNKYGDCKALSNYMQACLNAVDIKGYSAWIYGGHYPNSIDPDFPNDPFNHQILCVPLAKDTVWLECTSNISDFGVLGSFTENRSALLLTEEGGILINTPKSIADKNEYRSTSTITLQADGSGVASVQLNSTGEFKNSMMNYIFDQKKDDQKSYVLENLGFLQPDDFALQYNKASNDAATAIEFTFEKIPEFTAGNKMFLNPRIYKIWNYTLPKSENRTQDFFFPNPFIKTDTTIYKIPDGYALETLPKPKTIAFKYGTFKSTYSFNETKKNIITTARLELDEYKIPAVEFSATKKFFNEVMTEFTEKIVIKKL